MRLSGTPEVRETWIGTGDEAARITVDAMRGMVDDATHDFTVRSWAEAITRGCASYDDGCVVHRLYLFVHHRVRYRADPPSVELVKTPRRLLEDIGHHGVAAGDCDDSAVLLAALCETLGYPTRFVMLSERADGDLHHVQLAVRVGGVWVPLDPIVPGGVFGIGGRVNARRIVTE